MSPAPAPASNGNQCAKDVQLTEQCDCGSHTCNPSVNEGGTHTGTGPDTQCKSATNTCAAPCSQTDGHTEFSTPNFHDDCTCGTATCAGIPNGSDKYCDASTSTCASHAIATDATQGDAAPGTAPASANNDAIATTCASSSLTCQGTSFATPNAMCADAVCIASEFADASSTCCEALAPCTNGAIDLQNNGRCECGSSICKYGYLSSTGAGGSSAGAGGSSAGAGGASAGAVYHVHRWCEVASSTCADYPICSNTDASTVLVAPDYSTLAGFKDAHFQGLFCQCGTDKCEFNTNPSPYSHNHLKSKEYCDAASSRCTFEPCGNTDGTASNPVRCQCGMDECDVGQLGVSEPSGGYYCNAANHLCGATKDVNKFSSTVPAVIGPDLYKRRSAPMNYYTKCSSVAGTVAITDFIDCAEAAVAKGATISKVTSSDYPAGCLVHSSGQDGDVVFFNDMPEQFTKDETTYKMICKAGTLCPNIGGSATNANKCVCGSKECAPGSTCKSSESLCTLVSQAEKIAEIETNQKTCCSKNAALEAEIALLKKQYEGIDKVCKTTSSDGKRRRLASSGCGGGGTSMSNTNTPDGLSPGDIAAIVIVPIVVLLGCVGGCIMYMQQQTEKIEKTPENLYELKNFTPKRVTVELFDVRGSMNSNNPLTERSTLTIPELSIETDSSQSFTGTNPMLRNQ